MRKRNNISEDKNEKPEFYNDDSDEYQDNINLNSLSLSDVEIKRIRREIRKKKWVNRLNN